MSYNIRYELKDLVQSQNGSKELHGTNGSIIKAVMSI